MLLRWLKQRRRKRLTAAPFPESWDAILHQNVWFRSCLSRPQQQRLHDLIRVFVAEKNFEGCGGIAMTEDIQVTIAAQASLLVLDRSDLDFDHVLSILVYPSTYVAPQTRTTPAGVVIESGESRLGEAWWQGPVVLSWQDVLAGGRHAALGRNLVFHEFAHQLDMLNGQLTDGTPPMRNRDELQRWVDVMDSGFRRLVRHCRRGQRGLIDCYGAKNPAEFFAVVTEIFFQQAAALKAESPDLYDVLQGFFGLDPAAWAAGE